MPHVSLGRVSTPCGISVDSSMFMAHEEKSAKKSATKFVQTSIEKIKISLAQVKFWCFSLIDS